MGRHSAPDDPDDEGAATATATATAVEIRPAAVGRHSRPAEPAPAPAPAPAERPAPTTAPIEPAPIEAAPIEAASGHALFRGAAHNSAADLHLVRSHRGVLAACAVALVLPFAVEVVVLAILGTITGRSVLVWVWAPLVAAGVLLGVVLDLAHRSHAADPAPSDPEPSELSPR